MGKAQQASARFNEAGDRKSQLMSTSMSEEEASQITDYNRIHDVQRKSVNL